jgi:hypothetical protein
LLVDVSDAALYEHLTFTPKELHISSSKAKVLVKPMTGCLIRALNIHAVLAATTMTCALAPSSWCLMDISFMAWLGSYSNRYEGKACYSAQSSLKRKALVVPHYDK